MTRPSPSESAMLFDVGTEMEGNDGNMWKIVVNVNGTKRWQKVKENEKIKESFLTIKNNKTRPSPSESAILYDVGTEKVGNDGHIWRIVESVKGTKRWQKVINKLNDEERLINNVEDLKENFMYYEDDDGKKKYQDDLAESSKKWALYFRPAFEELVKFGIIAFMYPTGFRFTDYASEDTIRKLLNVKYKKYYKKYWGKEIKSEEDIFTMPYMYYLAQFNDKNDVYIKHNLPTYEQQEMVKRVLKKYYEKDYSWDGTDAHAIRIIMKGKKAKKEPSFLDLLRKKLKRDGFSTKVIQQGDYIGYKDDEEYEKYKYKEMSIVRFKPRNEDKLTKLLKLYGMKKLKYDPKDLYFIFEDNFRIHNDILYVNFTDIGMDTYKMLSS
jgi:hypothetical protein